MLGDGAKIRGFLCCVGAASNITRVDVHAWGGVALAQIILGKGRDVLRCLIGLRDGAIQL